MTLNTTHWYSRKRWCFSIPFAAIAFRTDRPFLLFSAVVSTWFLLVSILSKWTPRYLRWLVRSVRNVTAGMGLPAALLSRVHHFVLLLLFLLLLLLFLHFLVPSFSSLSRFFFFLLLLFYYFIFTVPSIPLFPSSSSSSSSSCHEWDCYIAEFDFIYSKLLYMANCNVFSICYCTVWMDEFLCTFVYY